MLRRKGRFIFSDYLYPIITPCFRSLPLTFASIQSPRHLHKFTRCTIRTTCIASIVCLYFPWFSSKLFTTCTYSKQLLFCFFLGFSSTFLLFIENSISVHVFPFPSVSKYKRSACWCRRCGGRGHGSVAIAGTERNEYHIFAVDRQIAFTSYYTSYNDRITSNSSSQRSQWNKT